MRLGGSSRASPTVAFLVFTTLGSRAAAIAAQAPTFPAATEVVTVDVLVLDKNDQPVSGLAREDFRVLEDGKPQTLTAFEEVETKLPESLGAAPPRPAAPPSASRLVGNTEVPPTRRTFGIVFDNLKLDPLEIESVRRSLRAFLARETRPGDRLLLLRTSDGRFWTTTGGAESASFAAALEQVRSGPLPQEAWTPQLSLDRNPSGRTSPGTGQLEQAMAEASRKGTLTALRDGIAMLGAQRDRKALVLVSAGFVMDHPDLLFVKDHLLDDVRDAAARANAVVYFLDARRQTAVPEVLDVDRAAVPTNDVLGTTRTWREAAEGARVLAEQTGGLWLQTNDFAGFLQRVADESRVTYLLGYEPNASRRDGRYHALKVEVLRPGMHVRARSGYVAAKSEAGGAAGIDVVQRALQDPFDRAEIPLRLATYVLGSAPAEAGKADGKAKLEVIVAAELRQAALESQDFDGRRLAEPRLLVSVGTPDGKPEISEWRLKVPVPAAALENPAANERWHPFMTSVPLSPGDHRVRVVVESGGRVGSLTTDLAVPKLDDERLSTPILSDVRAGEKERVPLLPIARRSFASADTLHLWVELHGAAAAPDTRRPRTSASFRARSADGVEWAAGSFDGVAGAQQLTEWLVSVPLGKAPAGESELALTVRDLVSNRSFESREPFRVEPRTPAEAVAQTKDHGGTPLATILERAGAYVSRYGESFRNLVAEEAYRQAEQVGDDASPSRVTNLRSDVVFVPLPGPIPWGTFRDVYEVNGKGVHDRDQRLERLFARPSGSSYEQARAILREGARYNLGAHGMDNTINSPTLGLLFLLPQNQGRLSFEPKGTKTIAGFETVEVAFQERSRPTLVRGRGDGDILTSGSFWIDPSHGTVLRTRIGYGPGAVTTEFRREPALDIFVPDTMTERYTMSRAFTYGSHRSLEGRASYRNYRRFQVQSDWEATETTP